MKLMSKVSFYELYLHKEGHENAFEIKQKPKCTTVNWQKCTKFHVH